SRPGVTPTVLTTFGPPWAEFRFEMSRRSSSKRTTNRCFGGEADRARQAAHRREVCGFRGRTASPSASNGLSQAEVDQPEGHRRLGDVVTARKIRNLLHPIGEIAAQPTLVHQERRPEGVGFALI